MDVSNAWEDAKWWSGAYEEDTTLSLELEGEHGAWARGFLPPPPRPVFLEETHSDGLTTCDLCTWATSTYSTLHPTLGDNLASLPWSISLVVVSIVSALIGATLMVTLRRCIKKLNTDRVARLAEVGAERREGSDKEVGGGGGGEGGRRRGGGGGLWTLRNVGSTPSNHYTVDEALYAELDKPVYQNTSSATPPSSAYYSDLSDRTYETVGNSWEMAQRPLAVIDETPVHSDYV